MKPCGPGLLSLGSFFIIISITVLVIGPFIFSSSSWLVLEGYTFLRICLFLPGCAFYWHIVACISFLWSFVFLCLLVLVSYGPLYFCVICGYIYFFISKFIDLTLLLFLDEAGLSVLFLLILFFFSKNQLLVLLIFAIVPISFSFISALIFMIYFLLLTLWG